MTSKTQTTVPTSPVSEAQLVRVAVAQKGSLIVGILMVFSLFEWWSSGVVLVNPAASLMILIACPFFWAMGGSLRHGR